MRLVIVEDWAKVEPPQIDPWLVTSVARAHVWLQQLLSGEVRSIQQIAQQEKVSEGHVSRTLRCAFLAPDVVETLLAGRQPPDLTVRQLVKSMPLAWTEQRKVFGLTSRPD